MSVLGMAVMGGSWSLYHGIGCVAGNTDLILRTCPVINSVGIAGLTVAVMGVLFFLVDVNVNAKH